MKDDVQLNNDKATLDYKLALIGLFLNPFLQASVKVAIRVKPKIPTSVIQFFINLCLLIISMTIISFSDGLDFKFWG